MSRLIVLPLFCLLLVLGCTIGTPLVHNKDYSQYPNPFCPSTTLVFALPTANHVLLTIYNISGEVVDTLVNDSLQAGHHKIEWDAMGFDSGVYFYRLEAGDFIETKKMVLLK